MVNFKKCAFTNSTDTPNGSTELSTTHNFLEPSFLGDPLGLVDSGQYPKLAAMKLFYKEYVPGVCWVALDMFISDIGEIEGFSYWSESSSSRHVTTENKGLLCTIPRIKFKKFPSHTGISTSIRKIRIFRKLSYKKFFQFKSLEEKTALIGSFPANRLFFHFGVVRVDNVALENKVVSVRVTVGTKATLFRRVEVIDPIA